VPVGVCPRPHRRRKADVSGNEAAAAILQRQQM